MESDSKQNSYTKKQAGNMVYDDSTLLQSLWLRHCSVLADKNHWKFMESELRYVLYCGTILWAIHLISMAI
jgi:hypothetical protein